VEVDGSGDNGAGVLGRDLLDVHTTLGRSDEDDSLRGSVIKDSDIVLVSGLAALSKHDRIANATRGAGLLGDKLGANHLASELLRLFRAAQWSALITGLR
jgi:hypothetical protein